MVTKNTRFRLTYNSSKWRHLSGVAYQDFSIKYSDRDMIGMSDTYGIKLVFGSYRLYITPDKTKYLIHNPKRLDRIEFELINNDTDFLNNFK